MNVNNKKKGGCFKTGFLMLLVIFAIGFAISTTNSRKDSNKDSNKDNTENKKDTLSTDENLNNSLDVIGDNLNSNVKINELSQLQLLTLIKGSRLVIQKGLNSSTDSIKLKSEKLKKEQIKFQEKSFPTLRKKYVDELSNKLWENNIELNCVNKSCTEMNIIGGVFASNKNIKEFYETMFTQLDELRFKKINFKWIKLDDEFQYYDIPSKKDSEF